MEKPFLGVIADDYTGATDIASLLVRGGMRTYKPSASHRRNLQNRCKPMLWLSR